MKKIREIIRLINQNPKFSKRQIAAILNISHTVVLKYTANIAACGKSTSELLSLNDNELIQSLQNINTKNIRYEELESQFEFIFKEMKRPHVTLKILWEEYKRKTPDGYSYSQYAYHYQMWKKILPISMHMEHKAGDKLYIDFAGKKFKITDRETGKTDEVESLIGVMGCSQLTYVEAVENQKKDNFIQANVNCMEYIGGVPNAIVPDCLKSGVTKSSKYEPVINPHFNEMAKHYGTVILPARPGKPKDKSLVEGAVKIVYQRIYAALRDKVFYSLNELNIAIKEELEKYNNRPMQKLKISRRELFEQVEKEAMKPLPKKTYEVKKFLDCKVASNYHIYIPEDKHYYSVPYRFRGQRVEVHYTCNIIEIYHKHERIAFYSRIMTSNKYTTLKEHMPPAHQFVSGWSRASFIGKGKELGNYIGEIMARILDNKKHLEQGYKSCMGILSLKSYGPERLNLACKISLESGEQSYRRVKWVLSNELDLSLQEKTKNENLILPVHENIRGKEYYLQEDKE